MDNDLNACSSLTETEDQLLQSIETSQMLLTALLTYIKAHAHDLHKEASINIAIAIHHIFTVYDRKLIELRMEVLFFNTSNQTEK